MTEKPSQETWYLPPLPVFDAVVAVIIALLFLCKDPPLPALNWIRIHGHGSLLHMLPSEHQMTVAPFSFFKVVMPTLSLCSMHGVPPEPQPHGDNLAYSHSKERIM